MVMFGEGNRQQENNVNESNVVGGTCLGGGSIAGITDRRIVLHSALVRASCGIGFLLEIFISYLPVCFCIS